LSRATGHYFFFVALVGLENIFHLSSFTCNFKKHFYLYSTNLKPNIMKTSAFRIPHCLFLLTLTIFSNFISAQPQQPIWLQNESNCTVLFNIACTGDDCDSLKFVNGTYSMGPNEGDYIQTCPDPNFPDFAALSFYFPQGDNVAHYITFSTGATSPCAGLEGCSTLYPTMYQGTIEANCLGSQGEVRADRFTEYSACTIYFKYSD
jgi:hypothetical protein